MKSEIIIVKSSFKEMLTDVLIDFLIESAVIKSTLSATSALKVYCLFFKAEKTAAEVLKHDFSHTRLLY